MWVRGLLVAINVVTQVLPISGNSSSWTRYSALASNALAGAPLCSSTQAWLSLSNRALSLILSWMPFFAVAGEVDAGDERNFDKV